MNCQGENAPRQQKVPVAKTPGQRGGQPMKRINGTWYYQGKAYESFHEALKAAWPK